MHTHALTHTVTNAHIHTHTHTPTHAPHFAACSHYVDACIWHQASDMLNLKALLVSKLPACLGCVGIAYSCCPAFKHIQVQEVEVEQAARSSQACHISHELLHSQLRTQCITAKLNLLITAKSDSRLVSFRSLMTCLISRGVFVLGLVEPRPIEFRQCLPAGHAMLDEWFASVGLQRLSHVICKHPVCSLRQASTWSLA